MTLSDEMYKKIFELHTDAIIVIAADGSVAECNPAACKRRKIAGPESQSRSIHDAWGNAGDRQFAHAADR
jgi:PAS domain-containing protein